MKRDAIPGPIAARNWLVGGRVQGVGFRPFVYRLAAAAGLCGYVRNRRGQVEIFAQGPRQALERFREGLIRHAPPLAQPRIVADTGCAAENWVDFRILPSDADAEPEVHLPPDYFCCDDCLRELADPHDRRYRYPFINCTQCGPRYTLISRLPYDRANTSMVAFALCRECLAEYENPASRRFHAEPLACPVCGPRLTLHVPGSADLSGNEAALAACAELLRRGRIIAVKGVGGYHLMVDARSEDAVRRLRLRKERPDKPLAVMFAHDNDPAWRREIECDPVIEAALRDPARPIVLARRAATCTLAPSVAPRLTELGVMLAYAPLHQLLLGDFGGPLVATSANVSGEPVLTENSEAQSRLATVADAFLHHDRPILRPADDPVLRTSAGRARTVRTGRGLAPLEITLPVPLPRPTLAVGGHMKNTIALGWADRAVLSPHVGDFGSPRTLATFERAIAELQVLYGVHAQAVVHDAHPAYASTRWANASGLPHIPVLHHYAHASALFGEHDGRGHWLVFTWDGAGLGDDDTLWGGEALLGKPGSWRRVATMRPFFPPGGDKAAREPWRSAAALCWEAGAIWDADPIVLCAWRKRVNCPQTSAVGRLFDAAAALTGLVTKASYEGHAPMVLEATASLDAPPLPLPISRNALSMWQTDWSPLVALLLDARKSAAERAGIFHATLAQALLDQACAVRDERDFEAVGLTGGVFQNRLLTERAVELLTRSGFEVRLAERVPCNDGGLAFGQLVEAAGKT